MSEYLSIQDLFLVGLALDVVGAGLLVHGLIESPRELWMRGGTYWGHSGAAVVAQRASNRVDATFGIGSLVAGFVFQAVGYVLMLGLNETDPGWAHAFLALTLAIVAAAVVFGVYRLTRRWRLRQLLRRVAVVIGRERGWDSKTGRLLVEIGQSAGFALNLGEAPVDYLRRIFAVELAEGIEIDLD